MSVLHIPVGIPGCGKSTFATTHGVPIVSTDAIREQMGDVNDQSRNDEVFDRYHRALEQHLLAGQSVFADATNLDNFARAKLRDIAAKHGAQTNLIVFKNLGQAIHRNQARDRKVPSDVMLRMLDKHERAMMDLKHEGYDHVTEVSSVG
jgi:predicted kinase